MPSGTAPYSCFHKVGMIEMVRDVDANTGYPFAA